MAFLLVTSEFPAQMASNAENVIMYTYLSDTAFLLTFDGGWVGNVLKTDLICITTIWPNRWWRNTKSAGKNDPYQNSKEHNNFWIHYD